MPMERVIYILNKPNHSFNVYINTDLGSYNFFINITEMPKITECLVRVGNAEVSKYEFKSQAYAWACFASKIKNYAH